MEELKKKLFLLSGQFGASGLESDISEIVEKELSRYMETKKDNLGNVIGETEGSGVHILLDAHMDQIGLIVTSIEDNGFLRVAKCGGIDTRVLTAHEVTVWGKELIFGVVTSTPPHLLKEDEAKKASPVEEISIDIGMSKENAEKVIDIGTRVTLNSKQLSLLNNRVSAASLDNRAGVCSILRCIELLKNVNHNCKLTVLFSVQEETSGSGAIVGGFSAQADEAIAVDVSFATAPEIPQNITAKLGEGTMIGIAPTLDHEMSCTLEKIAIERKISYQIEVMGGETGTNADGIQTVGRGAKTALLSIPLRNMHTGCEMLELEDIESTAKLMAAYIMERGEMKNA